MTGSASKLIIFGLDCADPSLVFNTYADRMPCCRALSESGFAAIMRSTDPPLTIPAWSAMLTGNDPGQLGLYGLRLRASHAYDSLRMATSADVSAPRLWDVLGQRGLRSVLGGIPQTWPVQTLNGACIAGIPAPDTAGSFTYPDNLRGDILTQFPDYRIDIAHFRTLSPPELATQITAMTRTHFAAFRHLLETHAWDFAMVVEIGLDRLHHAFWHFMDIRHPLYPGDNPFQHVIANYYALLDDEIRRTIDAVPGGCDAMIVSDHGAQPMKGGVRINQWLINNGWLALNRQPAVESPLEPDMVDWTRTRAWGEGGYFGRIFFNVAGREPDGIVHPGELHALRQRLAAQLETMVAPDGEPMNNRVLFPERLYSEINGIPPDLMVYFGALAWRSLGGVGPNPDATGGAVFTRRNDRGPDGANHDINGICISSFKPDSKPDEQSVSGTFHDPGKCSILDVFPVVLQYFNINVSNDNSLIMTS